MKLSKVVKTMNKSRHWPLFAHLVATLGCAAQLYYICDLYFGYKTANRLEITDPSMVTVPDLYLCGKTRDIIFGGRLGVTLSEWLKKNRGKLMEELLDRVTETPGEILEKLAVNTNSFVERSFLAPNGSGPDYGLEEDDYRLLSSLIQVDTFLKENLICYRLSTKGDYNVSLDVLGEHVAGTGGTLWSISVPHILEFNSNVVTVQGREKSGLYGPLARSVTVDMTNIGNVKRAGHQISFWKIRTVLLEKPFPANCLNYEKSSVYESRDHCLNECLYEKTTKLAGLIHPQVVLESSVKFPIYQTDMHVHRKHSLYSSYRLMSNNTKAIFKNCSDICHQPSCDYNRYVTEYKGRLAANRSFVFDYLLLPPGKPDITSVQVPIVTWVDLVTYILSCLGFWFAFSPLTLLMSGRGKKHPKNEVPTTDVELTNQTCQSIQGFHTRGLLSMLSS